ncbi:universal stress protein [Spirillospora sp. NPDC048911]|uniref:universal stress protein n=1 Tax=Spirillospora sp. NPDC048911 TaxID=3364527 RepID=UPI0037164619
MTGPVVVGIDGSAHAWHALDWAAEHALLHGLPICLVHGSRAAAPDGAIPAKEREWLVAERRDLLEEARQYVLKQAPDLTVTTRLVTQEPGHALVSESDRAALVAVGSRGQGGMEGLMFGSVGLHVAAHARCPVLVVPRSAAYPSNAPDEIVVGVAERPAESRLLGWAFAEASLRGAWLVAVHATGVEFAAPHDRVIQDMELSEALAGWSSQYPDVRVKPLISDRTPARALTEASEHAHMVVVGARPRRGPSAIALGRTDHAVLHHSRCPVAIVPER